MFTGFSVFKTSHLRKSVRKFFIGLVINHAGLFLGEITGDE